MCRLVLGARKNIEFCRNIDKAREAVKSGEVILLKQHGMLVSNIFIYVSVKLIIHNLHLFVL